MKVKTFYAKIVLRLGHTIGQCIYIQKDILRKAHTQAKNNQLQRQKIQKGNEKQFHSTKVRGKVQETIRKASIIQWRITVAQVSRLNCSMQIWVSTWILKSCNINLKIQQKKNLENNGGKNPANLAMRNTTIPIQNNFSLLDSKQMILSKIANNENQTNMKINHADRHMFTQTEDMDMLDANVSTFITNENSPMQLISPKNIINSNTNHNSTLPINQLTQKAEINPSITKSSKQNIIPQSMSSKCPLKSLVKNKWPSP